jgi:hypothetical protein
MLSAAQATAPRIQDLERPLAALGESIVSTRWVLACFFDQEILENETVHLAF